VRLGGRERGGIDRLQCSEVHATASAAEAGEVGAGIKESGILR